MYKMTAFKLILVTGLAAVSTYSSFANANLIDDVYAEECRKVGIQNIEPLSYMFDGRTVAVIKKVRQRIDLMSRQGNSEATFSLALCYLGNSKCGSYTQTDKTTAFRLFKQAADAGYVPAMVNTGLGYFNGLGVRENKTTALEYFKRAAQYNDPIAQYNIGHILRYKKSFFGLMQNSEGKEWFGKSCDNGYEPGCEAYSLYDNEYHATPLRGYFIDSWYN